MFFASLFLIMVGGVACYFLCKAIHLPALVGYSLWGIFLGYLGWIDGAILAISSQIRKIALVIILTKAGLSLNLDDLKKVGRPAILMSFVPACIEMVTVGLLGPFFFALTYNESFLLGSVLGAVSPAVVVPMMVKLMEERRGTVKGIPGLVIAGSSADDIVMIVFYTVFLSIEGGTPINDEQNYQVACYSGALDSRYISATLNVFSALKDPQSFAEACLREDGEIAPNIASRVKLDRDSEA